MDSEELEKLAQILKIKNFGGVWASDQLESAKISLKSPIIVNCCPHQLPGKHWLAFYRIENMKFEAFDSSGSHPSEFENIIIPKSWGNHCFYSNTPLQHPLSDTCGLYAIIYCLKRARETSMSDIVSSMLFSDTNLTLNDYNILKTTQLLMREKM
jgi:hypothetical protein